MLSQDPATQGVSTNHFMPENVLDHVPFVGRSNPTISRWAWRDLASVYARPT